MKQQTKAVKVINPDSKDIPSNLGQYINMPVANSSGYTLVIRRSQNVKCGKRYDLKCIRSQTGSKDSGNTYSTNTHLSQEVNEICSFTPPIFYDNNHQLFFFRTKYSTPNWGHCGHQKIDCTHMKLGLSGIPDEARTTAEQMLHNPCPFNMSPFGLKRLE